MRRKCRPRCSAHIKTGNEEVSACAWARAGDGPPPRTITEARGKRQQVANVSAILATSGPHLRQQQLPRQLEAVSALVHERVVRLLGLERRRDWASKCDGPSRHSRDGDGRDGRRCRCGWRSGQRTRARTCERWWALSVFRGASISWIAARDEAGDPVRLGKSMSQRGVTRAHKTSPAACRQIVRALFIWLDATRICRCWRTDLDVL